MLVFIYPCAVNAIDKARSIKLNDVNIGHGDGPTKWNGCNWIYPLILFVILFLFKLIYLYILYTYILNVLMS